MLPGTNAPRGDTSRGGKIHLACAHVCWSSKISEAQFSTFSWRINWAGTRLCVHAWNGCFPNAFQCVSAWNTRFSQFLLGNTWNPQFSQFLLGNTGGKHGPRLVISHIIYTQRVHWCIVKCTTLSRAELKASFLIYVQRQAAFIIRKRPVGVKVGWSYCTWAW